jgi:O-antigen ligase
MTQIPAQAAMGWGTAHASTDARTRTRLRDILPAIAAVVAITLAHLAFGAVQPIAALGLSALLTMIAVVMLLAAGPEHVTIGMLVGGAVIALVGVTGLLGPLDQAGPSLAVLFAAGAVWSMGYIAARHRSALDAIWTVLLWGSIAYCTWMFIGDVATSSTDQGLAIGDAFETPANAAVLFGLMAIIGMARVLHIVKQMYAEGLPGSHMIDRLLRGGLGGLLLLVLSLTCLAIAGSRPGMLMIAGVLIGHAWWDLLPILTRSGSGLLARLAAFVLPFVALGLAAWGVASGWISDETIAPGIGQGAQLPNVQRIAAYMAAWAQNPAFGHGLGSIDTISAQQQTLANAKVMLAPGQAHNVFITWLAETGLVGLGILVLAVGSMHARILGALGSRRIPRTFMRLAVVASLLMLLHGVTDSSLDLPSAVWMYALILGAACGVASGGRSARHDPLLPAKG